MKLLKNKCPYKGKKYHYSACKFALKPNKEQNDCLDSIAKTLIWVFNQLLAYWQDFYEKTKQSPSTAQLEAKIKEITTNVENSKYYTYVFSQSLQHVRIHLMLAYKNFHRNLSQAKKCKRKIKNRKGKLKFLPNFKSIYRNLFSIVYPSRWKFGNKAKTKLILPKFLQETIIDEKGNKKQVSSAIRIIKHRNMKGKPKTITLTKELNRWYVSIVLEQIVDDKPELPKKSMIPLERIGGLDVGVVHLATLDDGTVLDSVNFDNLYKKVKALQRKFQKQEVKKEKVKGKDGKKYIKKTPSNRRKATIYQFRKLWLKIRNKRKNQLYHYALYLRDKYDVLFVEDLKIANMTKSSKGTKEKPGKNVRAKSGLNREILAKCWGQFFRILEYKFNESNKIFRKVPPKNTSQICSNCGNLDSNNRKSQSEFTCTRCDFSINADHNGATNIKYRGITYYLEKQLDRFSLKKLKTKQFSKLANFKAA